MIRICFLAMISAAAALAAAETESPPAPAKPAAQRKGESAAPTAEVTTPSAGEDAAAPARGEEPTAAEQGRDPFQPAPPADVKGDEDELLAAEASEIPPGIRVVAIARVAGRKAAAILAVPGCEEPIFVREHDIVRIEVAADDKATSGAIAPAPLRETPAAPPELQRLNPAVRPAAPQTPNERPAPAMAAAARRPKVRILYLYISKIDSLTVEAYPRARPDDKQIFR